MELFRAVWNHRSLDWCESVQDLGVVSFCSWLDNCATSSWHIIFFSCCHNKLYGVQSLLLENISKLKKGCGIILFTWVQWHLLAC